MKSFPTLYKKTSTGAIQQWTINVYQESMNSEDTTIQIVYGQLNSDKIQSTTDVISIGKNVGKKNETTPFIQAESEAKAKFDKQKKKGYVESIEAAQKEETDDLIEGGILPMLAHKYSDHAHKIKFPAWIQPKFDGIRCIAILKDGKCTLWSRTRKKITSMPHIVEQIEKAFPNENYVLDGELYNHMYRSDFERIVSLVRQEEPDPKCTDVNYYMYDMISTNTFEERFLELYELIVNVKHESHIPNLLVALSHPVDTTEAAIEAFNTFRKMGYEGAIIRNSEGKYANKRSYDLQKIKEFDDTEFEIIDIDEGRGKLSGHVGAFRCRTAEGKEFLAKMSGDTEQLGRYFRDHSLWKGKKLTVQYQGLTGKEGVPRFPVGIAIRDYE